MNLESDNFCYWKQDANKTLYWYQTDSEQQYQENLITSPEKLRKWGWINNSFKYNFNSYGFRCQEFTESESIVFLGCSVTLGVGLPEDVIFPTLIAESLKLPCYNLAVGGSSADTGFRIALTYLRKLKPKIVFATFLFHDRTELLTDTATIPFNPNMLTLKGLSKTTRQHVIEYYEKWIKVPETAQLNLIKNNLAIEKLCDNLNIKYLSQTVIPKVKVYSQARDLLHPGLESHKALAKKYLEKL